MTFTRIHDISHHRRGHRGCFALRCELSGRQPQDPPRCGGISLTTVYIDLNISSLVRFESSDLPRLTCPFLGRFMHLVSIGQALLPIVIPCLSLPIILVCNWFSGAYFILTVSTAMVSIAVLTDIISSNIARVLASTNTQLLPHINIPRKPP